MRVAGASYEQIADGLGIGVASAWRHVQSALTASRRVTAETADKVRAMELRRIDAIVVSLWPRRSDPRTADTILRAMDRRAKLEGLDAIQPAFFQHVNVDATQETLAELMAAAKGDA
jgi:hypothetical protein